MTSYESAFGDDHGIKDKVTSSLSEQADTNEIVAELENEFDRQNTDTTAREQAGDRSDLNGKFRSHIGH